MGVSSTSNEPLPSPQDSLPSPDSSLQTLYYELFSATSVLIAIFSTFLIHNYNPSTARKLQFTHFNGINSLTPAITNPSSGIFLTACVFYALGVSSFLSLHKNDRYQSHIIASGFALALLGTAIHGRKDGFFIPLKSFLSIYMVGAMLYSSSHHVLRRLRLARRDDNITHGKTDGGSHRSSDGRYTGTSRNVM